jgi:hypothetical protein
MKTCRKCNKEFELEHFNFQNKKKGILRPYCRYCDRARVRKNYHENREARLATQKEWQKRTGYKAKGSYKYNPIAGVYGMFRDGICYYVGSSKNLYRRRSGWVVKNSHLKLDMSKYVWGIIEECSNYREREEYYISIYNPEFNSHKK